MKSKLGLWQITESIESLIEMKAVPQKDISLLNTFSHEKRKKEWLITRILVENLTSDKNIEITYDKQNKPYLTNSIKHISISHSHSLLTVIISEDETGIDIELIKPNIEKIKERFLSGAELISLKQEKQREILTLLWCAKECLYKYYGKKKLTFKEHLITEPFDYLECGSISAWIRHPTLEKKFEISYEKLLVQKQEYVLAFIVG